MISDNFAAVLFGFGKFVNTPICCFGLTSQVKHPRCHVCRRRGDDLRSIMSQTTFQAVLVCVGAGRPIEELQQSQTKGPVWFGKFVSQTGPSGKVSRHIPLADFQTP
ncbi:Uncharacterized protein HZ326_22749 [Fusarium oxysporum f. sp. albedinis]|nr:Uncharacterized protein HZ326_22749 [Fusarium oxysporum f. sp. albedinis]